jgi:hypothetical protein
VAIKGAFGVVARGAVSVVEVVCSFIRWRDVRVRLPCAAVGCPSEGFSSGARM